MNKKEINRVGNMIKQIICDKVIYAINQAIKAGNLGQISEDISGIIAIEKTRNAEFGDYAVNVSPLARFAKMPPPRIAEAIVSHIDLQDTEINVISGFINFKLGKSWLNNSIQKIITENKDYGRNNLGNSEKVLLEYVSANPTGPLHIGHGRWAAVGSALSNLLGFSGYDVDQEFYINDAGNQVNNLGRSLWLRVLQALGYDAKLPETEEEGSKNYYPGEYLIDLAQDYIKENKEKAEELYKNNPDPYKPSDTVIKEMSDYAKAILLQEQKDLLNKFRVHFNTWFSETSLHETGEVAKTIEKLKTRNELYDKEDATWFKSAQYGDDQDRVIIKSDGSYTYLTADIAYHYDKLKRGYERLINIWGADHHGYVARIKAAIEALGYDSNCLEVLLGQLVNLIISGEQVRMGKRRKMLTLEELIDEVGVDATRYWMIMRSIDTTLDFDVDLAKSCSDENPVYYVQYAHARACSILRTATSERLDQDTRTTLPPFIAQEDLNDMIKPEKFDSVMLNALWSTNSEKEVESTKALILKLESFQDLILSAAKFRAPYQITRYIQELASDFHYFYTFTRVLNIEEPVMKARLSLVYATKQVINNALNLLGVNAPESM
ncbi:MAG: arginine--tRNA ligase [Candidatus Melainabacteria bacterium RIFOXYA12_FULL_32_12]|nr:MAG: arginine--tRNA ligase [Candidatus Melainabacteria bacterium RIFOXYA2_FULL_32_9]OGI31116.1 MAG: arginine--tRNA ligase [Candidatus Melainabacteria bacterium RIFOXYA12_FULL_32_12]